MGVTDEAYRLDKTAAEAIEKPVSCYSSCLTVGGVQVRASQGRRGRDTGSYLNRGERIGGAPPPANRRAARPNVVGGQGIWLA